MKRHGYTVYHDLRILLVIVAILCGIGTIFIYSASAVFAFERHRYASYFLVRHGVGLMLGVLGFFGIQLVPPKVLQTWSGVFFIAALFMTSMTLVPGIGKQIHGACRWVSLGGFMFQPSELLKIATILYLAAILARKDWSYASFIYDYLPLLLFMAVPCLLCLKQPDFGLTVTLVITAIMMLFLASVRLWHIAMSFAMVIPAALLLVIMEPYRVNRIMVFLNPWADPRGAGFQIVQSLIAIGCGSLFGLGIGNSRQKFFYLPMQHTDFIFSVIAEESGFIGACILILLYAGLLYIGLRLAVHAHTTFASLAIAGFTLLMGLQALINIAVAMGLIPTKGIGLPFVSYGSTALVCHCVMVGIICSLARSSVD